MKPVCCDVWGEPVRRKLLVYYAVKRRDELGRLQYLVVSADGMTFKLSKDVVDGERLLLFEAHDRYVADKLARLFEGGSVDTLQMLAHGKEDHDDNQEA